MNYKEVMAQLKALGTAQNRKVYTNHGVTDEMYGVSYANLEKLRKKIRSNHALGRKLWASGNHDARILATMICDPAELDDKTVDAWVKELRNYVVTSAFSGMVAKSPLARRKMNRWTKASAEFVSAAGWNIVAALAMRDGSLCDEDLEEHLRTIEDKLHRAPNRTRYSMNNALIAIGIRNAAMEKQAIATAKRIGKVEVDHGRTSCTTPDAVAYIRKARAHKKRK